MNRVCARVGIAVGVLICSMWAARAGAADELQGTVVEGGFGKFRMQDKAGTSWLIYLSTDGTTYNPAEWRPAIGDEVSVAKIEVQKRNTTISQATTVTRVKAGSNTVELTSPVQVEIVESGYTGFKAKILATGQTVKFSKSRSTQFVPAGWVPAAGDKATMTFTTKSSVGSRISYALDKVEKADAAAAK